MIISIMRLSSTIAVKFLVVGCLLGYVLCTPPNVIIILADDLGYGDLGWSPFNSDLTKNIQAPNLKAMAKNGMIMTNFHTASPLCSPSRASIMVGLFPWRFGVDFIYAGDLKKDSSEEMDHEQLPLVPNIAMSFRDAGYYTAHIGKWHLGGQSHIEIPNRQASTCSTPGINQYGFDEYVGMSEGTNSMRYWTHQRKETYHAGSKYLFRNDIPLKAREQKEILTDRQAEEAIRVIREQTLQQKPFFLNLWFDAPHSPWEPIEPFFAQYNGKFGTPMLQKYASMVTSMDMNIGQVLKSLDELGIANNTIVVFTSDNGPENEAGSPGPFKGRKRLLSEGGIRVPTIVQWKGRIRAGSSSDLFMLTTDLWPTLTEAAGIPMPSHNRIDGVSLLPRLLDSSSGRGLQHGDERTVLWYTHSIGFPKLTAAWSHGFKVMWNDYEGRKSKNMPAPFRMFDMRRDPTENLDIMPLVTAAGECEAYKKAAGSRQDRPVTWVDVLEGHGNGTNSGVTINRQYAQAALHLLQHLHTKMHLFRHEGELDWSRYHVNKPYETAPHCGIRRSAEVDPFPFSNSLQVQPPEFCGSSVYQQYWGVSCRCTAQHCDNGWTLGAGSVRGGSNTASNAAAVAPVNNDKALVKYYKRGQPILEGLSYISPESGSLVSYTRAELQKWTDFQPRCEGSDPLAESHEAVKIADTCILSPVYVNADVFMTLKSSDKNKAKCKLPAADWAVGNVVRQNQWERLCHQRVALDTHSSASNAATITTGVRLQPNSCGFDYPVLTISTHGMVPTYLSLCPESMNKFHTKKSEGSSGSYMDDNVMMVALNLLLLNEVSPVYSAHSATEDKEEQWEADLASAASQEKSVPFVASGVVKNVSIVDPLFFQYLGLHKHSQSSLRSPSTDAGLSLQRKGIVDTVAQLWGFIAPFERRLSNSASGSHQVDYLVFPIYHELVWSVAVIHNLRSSDSAPSIVYFDPISSNGNSVMAKVVQQVLSEVVRRSRHSEESILLPITALTPSDKQSEGSTCNEYETSGLKVLLFLKNLKELMSSGSVLSADLLLKNVNNHFVEIERKALIAYFMGQSKRDYGRRKKYLKNMSSKKMLAK